MTTGLLRKLHSVADAIAYVEKRGDNDHHHYKYAQAVDVVRQVRDELLKQDVVVIPGASDATHLPYGTKGGHLTTLTLHYRFFDVETGDSIEVPWVGAGVDIGGDKGLYKAYTGGLKYMLLTTFLIPTSDDPERDSLTQAEPPEERAAAPRIPLDRAQQILKKAFEVGMATLDPNAEAGSPPVFHAVFKAALLLQGVERIGNLNVDQAEAIEEFLRGEGQEG